MAKKKVTKASHKPYVTPKPTAPINPALGIRPGIDPYAATLRTVCYECGGPVELTIQPTSTDHGHGILLRILPCPKCSREQWSEGYTEGYQEGGLDAG